MQPQVIIAGLSVGLALTVGLGLARAEPDPPPVEKHSGEDPQSRAGHPKKVAWWAVPSVTPSSVGYYVGGGSVCQKLADPRAVDEGTWGWDYQGCLLPRRVMLGWWHGRCYQGGVQSYKVDGPRLEPHELKEHEHH